MGWRIVLIGHFAVGIPPFLTKAEGQELQESSSTFYSFTKSNYTVAERFAKRTHHLVLNLDKKEYLDPTKFKEPATNAWDFAHLKHGVMQGLHSLVFYSTEVAEGDVEAFIMGRWAGQHITIREKDKFKDLDSWVDISEKAAEDVEEFVLYR
ncbi:hypothetical protein BGZ65_007705 [Modicella reniformis]|uniref:Uncharacterized protein n=1 Tax=Modicella reniformis TaxID=1440133 RepID=A0A9P6LR24_9FUNG|nr:hypothetical protein BGZ65_007705 [Modicella reniformis]